MLLREVSLRFLLRKATKDKTKHENKNSLIVILIMAQDPSDHAKCVVNLALAPPSAGSLVNMIDGKRSRFPPIISSCRTRRQVTKAIMRIAEILITKSIFGFQTEVDPRITSSGFSLIMPCFEVLALPPAHRPSSIFAASSPMP